jgi:hypothetical protein
MSKISTSTWGGINQMGGGCGALPKHCRQFGGKSGVAVVNAGVRTILPLRVRGPVWHVCLCGLQFGFLFLTNNY